MAEYIEHEALLKNIREKSNPEGCTHITPKDVYSTALTIIECEPVADVAEVRRGEWIPDDYCYYHCSECGYEHDDPEYVTPFCPNCGAKMDGGEE